MTSVDTSLGQDADLRPTYIYIYLYIKFEGPERYFFNLPFIKILKRETFD
jgi:hypothetical protein